MSQSSETPEVSVVMAVHNDARYVRECIRDLLQQQGVTLEIIVIDDGSSDATPEILHAMAAEDPRLCVSTQKNLGLTRSLIRGCAMARGDFIARQDADDHSFPDRLRIQAAVLRSDPTLSFVSSWAELIGPEDEPLLLQKRPADPEAATHLLVNQRTGPPGHGSVMMRRSAFESVGGYREKFYFAQDSDLWLRLAMVGRLAYVQRVLYRYRVSADSISGRLHQQKLPYAQLIDELHAARVRGEDDRELLQQAVLPERNDSATATVSSHQTNYFIGRCLVARRDPRARTYLRLAMRGDRRNVRAWIVGTIAELLARFWPAGGRPLT